MPLSLLYWILMLFWLICGAWWGVSTPPPGRYPIVGWSIVLFLLFLVIGLQLFGAPIRAG